MDETSLFFDFNIQLVLSEAKLCDILSKSLLLEI